MFKLLLAAIAALVFFAAPIVVPTALWLMKGAPMGDSSVSPELERAERELSEALERSSDAASAIARDAGDRFRAPTEKPRKQRSFARPFGGGEL